MKTSVCRTPFLNSNEVDFLFCCQCSMKHCPASHMKHGRIEPRTWNTAWKYGVWTHCSASRVEHGKMEHGTLHGSMEYGTLPCLLYGTWKDGTWNTAWKYGVWNTALPLVWNMERWNMEHCMEVWNMEHCPASCVEHGKMERGTWNTVQK